MAKPSYVVLSDHALDRLREHVAKLSDYSEIGLRRVLCGMYHRSVPYGGQYGDVNQLRLARHDSSSTELVLACERVGRGVVIKTVLSKDHAIANVQALRRK